MKPKHFAATAVIFAAAWMIWAGHWSESAARCLDAGGTRFDAMGWSCHKHERITLGR